MRKSGAGTLFVHQNVENEAYFPTEYPAVAAEIEELHAQLSGYKFAVHQLSFFESPDVFHNRAPPSQQHRRGLLKGLLATCVVIEPIPPTDHEGPAPGPYLFEAVVGVPSHIDAKGSRQPLWNNYVHVGEDAEVCVAGLGFRVECAYYCQGNQVSSVCAHSCLKMALWHVHDVGYQLSTAAINKTVRGLRAKSKEPFRPRGGLQIQEIQALCEANDADALMLDCNVYPGIPPYEFAYLLVESGIPTIVAFSPTMSPGEPLHLLTVVGHTMNSDEWTPHAVRHYPELSNAALHTGGHQYLSSCEWASHLIVHDDVIGPYMYIGPHTLTRNTLIATDPGARLHYVIGVVSKSAALPGFPYAAQEVAARYFWSMWEGEVKKAAPSDWRDRITAMWTDDGHSSARNNLVLRTQVMRRESYHDHLLRAARSVGGNDSMLPSVENLTKQLPDRFWMIEFSLPTLFSTNRCKLGEILLPLEAAIEERLLRSRKIPRPLLFRVMDHISCGPDEVSVPGLVYSSLYRRKNTIREY